MPARSRRAGGHGSAQKLLFSPQTIPGVTRPVNAAQDFVLGPLTTLAATDPGVAAPLAVYQAAPAAPAAPAARQLTWANAYANAVTKVKFANGSPVVPAADDGPVPALMAGELSLARSGALDTDLLSQQPCFGTNFAKPLLFIEDGAYFADQATAMGLTGSQWGVMNETGSYPGQPWLWLYTLWYQVPGWDNSANIDMIAVYMTGRPRPGSMQVGGFYRRRAGAGLTPAEIRLAGPARDLRAGQPARARGSLAAHKAAASSRSSRSDGHSVPAGAGTAVRVPLRLTFTPPIHNGLVLRVDAVLCGSWRMMVLRGFLRMAGCRTVFRLAF